MNRNILFFLSFALIGMNLLSDTITPTVENLNAMVLFPTHEKLALEKEFTIGQLFKEINENGVPEKGTISVPANEHYPYWQFQKGLPSISDETIFLHSSPRDDVKGRIFNGRSGHGLLCCNQWIKNSIINAPFITFDYFYDRKGFDFGTGININCLDTIYQELISKNPHAHIVVAGTCIGAKIALEHATTHPVDHVKAFIFESPYVDANRVMKNWSNRYTWFVPGSAAMIKGLFKTIFPDFKKVHDDLYRRLKNMPKDVPIFIGHLNNDSFCTNHDMWHIIQELQKNRPKKNVYLLVISDPEYNHGHLNSKKEFAQATNAFLAEYNLPHDAALAEQGKELLAKAQKNAYAKSEKQWIVVKAQK